MLLEIGWAGPGSTDDPVLFRQLKQSSSAVACTDDVNLERVVLASVLSGHELPSKERKHECKTGNASGGNSQRLSVFRLLKENAE